MERLTLALLTAMACVFVSSCSGGGMGGTTGPDAQSDKLIWDSDNWDKSNWS